MGVPVIFKGANAKMLNSGALEFKDNTIIDTGTGSPEGSVTAEIGSEYLDTTNGDAYIKETGSGNTGWTVVAKITDLPSAVEDRFIPTLGQTVFTASSTPSGDAAFALYKNGQLRVLTTDYTRSGTTVTWQDPGGETLETDDQITLRYNDTSVSSGTPFDPLLLNNHSVDLDGVNDFLAIGATVDLQFERTNAFSFSFWFRPQTTVTQAIYSAELTAGTFRGVAIRLIAGKIRFILTSTTATNQLSIETTASYALTQWQHVVIIYDGSSSASGVTIYRDNASEALTTITDNLSATTVYTAGIRIGSRTDGAQPYQNFVDDFAIFDTELDGSDVAELFVERAYTDYINLTKGANLIHWWRMGDGATGSTIPDEIASSDATITNTLSAIQSEAP